jgi:hypothetical protein
MSSGLRLAALVRHAGVASALACASRLIIRLKSEKIADQGAGVNRAEYATSVRA